MLAALLLFSSASAQDELAAVESTVIDAFDDDWIMSTAEEPVPGLVTADGEVPDNAILVKDPAFGTAEAYVVNGYGEEVPLDTIQESYAGDATAESEAWGSDLKFDEGSFGDAIEDGNELFPADGSGSGSGSAAGESGNSLGPAVTAELLHEHLDKLGFDDDWIRHEGKWSAPVEVEEKENKGNSGVGAPPKEDIVEEVADEEFFGLGSSFGGSFGGSGSGSGSANGHGNGKGVGSGKGKGSGNGSGSGSGSDSNTITGPSSKETDEEDQTEDTPSIDWELKEMGEVSDAKQRHTNRQMVVTLIAACSAAVAVLLFAAAATAHNRRDGGIRQMATVARDRPASAAGAGPLRPPAANLI